MSNPNLVVVYSPEGEMFETTRANARDLITHVGWSTTKPEFNPSAAKAAEPEEPAHAADEREGSIEDAEGTTGEGSTGEAEAGTEEAGEEEVLSSADAELFTEFEQFAHLETREQVVEYLADKFPDFKPHHKSSRDGLVAKAIELAGE